jgi:hypothetical protein
MVRRVKRLLVLLVVGGCTPARAIDCDGAAAPGFARAVRAYVTERLLAPRSSAQFAADLDGDGRPDNQLGNLLAALLDVAPDADGAAPLDLAEWDGPTRAGTLVLGAPDNEGDVVLDGDRVTCRFVARGSDAVTLRLPVLAAAPPLRLDLVGLRLSYERQDDGRLRGALVGAIAPDDVARHLVPGLAQILTAQLRAGGAPSPFDDGGDGCATGGDGAIDPCELAHNRFFAQVTGPDVGVGLSAGFGFVAQPTW